MGDARSGTRAANRKRRPRARRETRGKPRNRLLAALTPLEYRAIAKDLQLVEMEAAQLLIEHDETIENVYFIEHGVASVVSLMGDGSAVETATVGNEGIVGLAVFHGVDRTAAQAFCQIRGDAFKMSVADFRRSLSRREGNLRSVLGRYTEALFTLVGQSSACNRVHSMQQRCARWLLHTVDRVGADEFDLTHRFLAQMMGVRRASVTEVMSSLQKMGVVTYSMGHVRILDRKGIERVCCECYSIINDEFDRLLEGRKVPRRAPRVSKGGKTLALPPQPNITDQ